MTTIAMPESIGDDGVSEQSVLEPRTLGPLIVATDCTESSDPAFVAARIIAHRCGADVEVVTVVEPIPSYAQAGFPFAVPLDTAGLEMDRRRIQAERQLHMLVGDAPGWSVETAYGPPAPTLRRVAAERASQLVITGVSRHGLLDRVLGEETAAHMAQITETPALAVVPSMTRLPRIVVVAIDLDSPPLPRTAVIRALLSEATAVYFVNAKPRVAELQDAGLETWGKTYRDGLMEAADRVKRSMDLEAAVFRQLVTLTGSPAKEILSFAQYARADLIILGQRRRWMLHRRIGGGVPTRILRGTTCSVLVLPRPRAVAEPVAPKPPGPGARTETITDRSRWAARLADLSRRNAGRRVTMEIDDLDLGVQAQALEYPFVGMDYDHQDDRIEIMLGQRQGRSAHLTHSISAPVSVDILEGANGAALAVRAANDRGQALLTFLL